MAELGFVVLHYKTLDDTRKCVDSILNNVSESPIVVVDNGSGNGTGNELKKIYLDNKLVTVICLENNLGFAKGNNVGINFLKANYELMFIAVMNNDTLIEQDHFDLLVAEEYAFSHFSVLGPQIITKDGTNFSNPVEDIVDTRLKVIWLIIKREIKLILNYIHLDFFIHDTGSQTKRDYIFNNLERHENVKLHGACWIFSGIFFQHYAGLDPSTFLYFEEDILFWETVRNGLKTVYNPNLIIRHCEDSATNSMFATSREKNIFVLKNEIKSLRILLGIIKKGNSL